jgi:hypothetical protein
LGPQTKHGPPRDLFGVLGHAVRAAARLFWQLGRQGRSRAKRIGGGSSGGPRGGGNFRVRGISHGGGLRGGNLNRLGGSVRAGRKLLRD